MKKKLQSKPWYPGTVTACIAVVLYVVLTRQGAVVNVLERFVGFFSPLLLGCIIAYLVNPLSRLFSRSICRGIKNENRKAAVSNILAFVAVFLIVALLLLVSVPQLIASITDFAGNLKGYVKSFDSLLLRWDLLGLLDRLGLDNSTLISSTEDILQTAGSYLTDNLSKILNTTVGAGKGIVTFLLGFILSIYLLAEKSSLKSGSSHLLQTLMSDEHYEKFARFLSHCDAILNRYIVFNIIDCLIVGVLNAVFMLILRMPYAGLVSFVVAITNLIPTFGPIIGAAIGAFLLVLVNPLFALAFLAFTLVLQTCDGYIIKPRMFGNTLGVSGLWIMTGVIIGGRIFGIGGILVAIPAVAILDYIYRDILLPRLERRKAEREAALVSDHSTNGSS